MCSARIGACPGRPARPPQQPGTSDADGDGVLDVDKIGDYAEKLCRDYAAKSVLTENESSFVENIPHTPPGPLGTAPDLVYLSTPREEGLQRSRLAHLALASPSTQVGCLQPALADSTIG